jgi:hypothetical protein
LAEGIFGFQDSQQGKAGQRSVQNEFGHFEQRLGVTVSVLVESIHDRIVDGLLAEAANSSVRQPEQWVPPISDLKERLGTVDPHVAALKMD